MLTYTMSDDLNEASIGPCNGGFVRLSIIRICKRQGWEFPPETLDEDTDLETLRDINLDLLFRRARLRKAAQVAEAARRSIEQAEREAWLPPEIAAKVADLRSRASGIRSRAVMAERLEDMNLELAEADRVEAVAFRLVNVHQEGLLESTEA
jgi:hypothetical protein